MQEHSPIEIDFKGQKFTLTDAEWQEVRQDFERLNPRNSYMLLFMVVVVVMWFGCNNAAKEIVKEEAIYGRERAVNLGVAPYLASKFLVLSVVTMLHALILMTVVFGVLEGRAAFFLTYSRRRRIPDWLCGAVWRAGAVVDDRRGVGPAAVGVRRHAGSGQRASALCADPAVHSRRRLFEREGRDAAGAGVVLVAGLLGLSRRASGANQLPETFPGCVDYIDELGLPCRRWSE